MPPSGHETTVSTFLSRCRYNNVPKCKSDILGALHHYNGLKPKLDKFTFNDGRARDLIVLEGTVPVPYRTSMYNIPVALWILDTHPIHAPLCYVRPTPDMQIKVSQHVDGNGKIYLPYLHEWDAANSDILGLVQMCIITFGEQPPVFARPQNQGHAPQQAQPPPQPSLAYPQYPAQQPQQSSPYGGGYQPYPPVQAGGPGYPPPGAQVQPPAYPPSSTQGPGGAYPPAYPPPAGQAPGYNRPESAVSTGSSTITQEHILMSMRSGVEDAVRRKLRDEYAIKNTEIQSLKKVHDELNTGQMNLKRAIETIDRETEGMDRSLQELKIEQKKLEEAKREAEQLNDATDMKPEDAVSTTTPLYRQLLNAHAEESAVHEAIYYLGEAMKQEIIDCDVFLKQVRKMARRQFFLKATMNKCRKVAGLPV